MPIRDRVAALLAEPQRLAIVAGAGMSVPPPSSLPTALGFLRALFEDVAEDGEHRRLLQQAIAPASGQRQTVGDYLRFEAVMESLWTEVDSNLNVLSIFSSCAFPNAYHRFLAAQLARGAILLTTNFDNLIEQSCREAGLAYDLIVTDRDLEAFTGDPSRFAHPLIKLHGGHDLTFGDGRTLAGAHNVGATITQVARMGLSTAGRARLPRVLAAVAASRHLLICGYSGCDDLDIIPALTSVDVLAGMTWLQHGSGEERWMDEAALAAAERTPDGVLLDPALRLLQHFRSRSVASAVSFVQCGTASALGVDFAFATEGRTWREQYHAWRRTALRPGVARTLLVARLLRAAGAGADAARLLETLLARDELTGGKRARAQCFLADILIARGDGDAAVDHLIDVIGQPPGGEVDRYRALAYTLLARIHVTRGEQSEAMPFVEAALAIAKSTNDVPTFLDALYEAGQLAIALGSPQDGVKRLRESTRVSREIGDCTSVAMGHIATGRALMLEGDLAGAKEELDQGIALAALVGDRRTLLFGHHGRGVLAEEEGEWPRARAEYEQAILFARSVVQPRDLGHSLNNLGKVLMTLGDYGAARRALRESLQVKKRFSDPQELVAPLSNLGALYMACGKPRQAGRVLGIVERLTLRIQRPRPAR